LGLQDLFIVAEFNWRKHSPNPLKADNIIDLDYNYKDPRLSTTLACEIYESLREAEVIVFAHGLAFDIYVYTEHQVIAGVLISTTV